MCYKEEDDEKYCQVIGYSTENKQMLVWQFWQVSLYNKIFSMMFLVRIVALS